MQPYTLAFLTSMVTEISDRKANMAAVLTQFIQRLDLCGFTFIGFERNLKDAISKSVSI